MAPPSSRTASVSLSFAIISGCRRSTAGRSCAARFLTSLVRPMPWRAEAFGEGGEIAHARRAAAMRAGVEARNLIGTPGSGGVGDRQLFQTAQMSGNGRRGIDRCLVLETHVAAKAVRREHLEYAIPVGRYPGAIVARHFGLDVRADRIRDGHLDLIVDGRRPEIADVEVHSCPGRIGALDDLNRVLGEISDAAVVFDAENQPARAGILGAALQRLGGELDRLRQRGPLGLRAAEDAHVSGPDLLRNIQPFAQLAELLLAQFGSRLREPDACANAVDFDPIPA